MLLAFSTPSLIHSSKRMRSDLILWLSSEGGYFPNGTALAWVPQPTHGLCGIFSGEAQRHSDTQLTTPMFRANLLHRWNYLVFLLAWGTVKNTLSHQGLVSQDSLVTVLTPDLPFFLWSHSAGRELEFCSALSPERRWRCPAPHVTRRPV